LELHLFSQIVPAYHEALNIKPLVTQVFEAFPESQRSLTEIIIVDDNSEDGTVETCESLKEQGYNLVLVERKEAMGGLSTAVLRGFEEARGTNILVMDADLQHPPEKVPTLFNALSDKTPFALGTRYGPGVEMDRDWPLYRRVISWGARTLARPLTSAGDPMSGFFALKKDLVSKLCGHYWHSFSKHRVVP
jgi:dolichol-phosphate mannosyltransferase